MINRARLLESKLICLWILLTVVLNGCSSDGVEPPPPVTFYVNPSTDVNNGRMVYLIIRQVGEKAFLDQTYNAVAAQAFPTADDPGLMGTFPIFPNEKKVIELKTPAKDNMGIYLMFTQPGKLWKNLIQRPFEDSYSITLPGGNNVTVGPEPGFFERWSY